MSKLFSLSPEGLIIDGAKDLYDNEDAFSAVFDPGNLRDVISGDSVREAGEERQQAALNYADIIKQGTQEARNDIFRLFPQAQQYGQQGFQSALDVFGQTLPQQANLLQGGNVAAQQQLLAGQPQFMNAILGNQVDMSGLQPYQSQPIDFGFTNQQLPPIQSIQPPMGPTAPGGGTAPMVPPNAAQQLANLLGGR